MGGIRRNAKMHVLFFFFLRHEGFIRNKHVAKKERESANKKEKTREEREDGKENISGQGMGKAKK